MATITEFNKQNLPVLREEIDVALKALGEKYGIVLHAGNASFLGTSATFKLEMAVKGDGVGSDNGVDPRMIKYAEALKRFAHAIDLDITRTYIIRGKAYKVVGYNSKAREYPLLLEDQKSKKIFKFDIESVERAK